MVQGELILCFNYMMSTNIELYENIFAQDVIALASIVYQSCATELTYHFLTCGE